VKRKEKEKEKLEPKLCVLQFEDITDCVKCSFGRVCIVVAFYGHWNEIVGGKEKRSLQECSW